MKLAVCQVPDIHGDVERSMALIQSEASAADGQGADIVGFPECFLQGYDLDPNHIRRAAIEIESAAFNAILEALEPRRATVVFGMIESARGRYYNAAVAVQRGQVIAHYRKRHLLKAEEAFFDSGTTTPVFEVGSIRIALGICHDLTITESAQVAARAGATVLLCPCNNRLPRATAEAWKHRHTEIRTRRAREHGLWIATSDVAGGRNDEVSYGPTAVIDPTGRVVAQVPLLCAGHVIAEIHP